ncbi:MAG: hypothetical protein AAFU77_01395 [Myxococcota bacterium]
MLTALLIHTLLAQPSPTFGNIQLYRPAADSAGVMNVVLAGTGLHLSTRVGTHFVGARNLLEAEIDSNGAPLGSIVSHRNDAIVVGNLSLFERFDVGFSVPYTVAQGGLDTDIVQTLTGQEDLPSSGLGDVSVLLKAELTQQIAALPAVAVGAELTFPTGDPEALLGEEGMVYAPFVAFSRRFGEHHGGVNVGYRVRPEELQFLGVDVGNELFYRVGFLYAVDGRRGPSKWNVYASLFGHSPIEQPFGLGAEDDELIRTSLEANLGVQRRIATDFGGLRVTGGLGTGLSSGYGSPELRFLFGVDYVSVEPLNDDDQDRLPNQSDACPYLAEDYDDFEDSDGCPELDNDGDGIEDLDDGCPLEPEDLDGHDDYDGCAEVDDEDDDRDGVNNAKDKCPDAIEDVDGFEDEDGCPETDNDKDGLSDLNDLCPNQFEDQATSLDKDGCPGKSNVALEEAKVYGNKIVTPTTVDFERRSRVYTDASKKALDAIARLLRDRPDLEVVEIRVTQVGQGKGAKRLAEFRALGIMKYLMGRGVDEGRLRGTAGKVSRRSALTTFKLKKIAGN